MECQFCKKTFNNISSLNKHKKTAKYCLEIQGTFIEYKCECGKISNLKTIHDSHIKNCLYIINIDLQKSNKEKNDIIKEKNVIIKEKDDIIKEKDVIIKEKDEFIKRKQEESRKKYEIEINDIRNNNNYLEENQKLKEIILSLKNKTKTYFLEKKNSNIEIVFNHKVDVCPIQYYCKDIILEP